MSEKNRNDPADFEEIRKFSEEMKRKTNWLVVGQVAIGIVGIIFLYLVAVYIRSHKEETYAEMLEMSQAQDEMMEKVLKETSFKSAFNRLLDQQERYLKSLHDSSLRLLREVHSMNQMAIEAELDAMKTTSGHLATITDAMCEEMKESSKDLDKLKDVMDSVGQELDKTIESVDQALDKGKEK